MSGWTMGIDGWLWMGAWMLVLAVAIALLIWTPNPDRDRQEPIEVLRNRLARGEITPEEYERAATLLVASSAGGGKANP